MILTVWSVIYQGHSLEVEDLDVFKAS